MYNDAPKEGGAASCRVYGAGAGSGQRRLMGGRGGAAGSRASYQIPRTSWKRKVFLLANPQNRPPPVYRHQGAHPFPFRDHVHGRIYAGQTREAAGLIPAMGKGTPATHDESRSEAREPKLPRGITEDEWYVPRLRPPPDSPTYIHDRCGRWQLPWTVSPRRLGPATHRGDLDADRASWVYPTDSAFRPPPHAARRREACRPCGSSVSDFLLPCGALD